MSKPCKYYDFFLISIIGLLLLIAIYAISNIYSNRVISSYKLVHDLDTLNGTIARMFSTHGILYLKLSHENKFCLMCMQKNSLDEPVNLCEKIRIGDRIIYEGESRRLIVIQGISDSLIITNVK